MALKGINHVVLKVRDLERSDGFYRLLGFQRTGTREGMRFYTGGAHAHDLALVDVGPEAPQPVREGVGLFHFCVTVEREEELSVLHKKVTEAGHKVLGVTDHIVSRSFYALDPDGIVVEVTWDTPEAEWRNLDNPFQEDRPYELPPLPPEGQGGD